MAAVTQRQVFVARTQELTQLNDNLGRALEGQGKICFVTGEAGAGKSSLVTAFAEQAQAQHEDLVVALGTCDAQTGMGDPYLPFREILGLFTGDVEAKLAQGSITGENARRLRDLLILSAETLVEIGPDLLALFVPLAFPLALAGRFLAKKSDWAERLKGRIEQGTVEQIAGQQEIDQSQIFEQYINVLHALAESKPLVLVLEDLQWVDAASSSLLFRLGRRLAGSRILVVGTYRPNDVALGRSGERHPVEPVLSEMKRYYGDILLDLDKARAERGREFVDAYLGAQLNCLDESFREALYQRTGGQPLFTIELVRHMQVRDNLVQDSQGCWGEGAELSWDDLPSRIEGVVEERVARLGGELGESLKVASVEGELFTAEVVAEVQRIEVRGLVRQLSGELQKEHMLVRSEGVERLEARRLSRYRFSNRILQTYLYRQLDEVQASYLHEDVGRALEDLYGQQAPEIAVQLARHFELAGVRDKALQYLWRAGEQAAARFANQDAISYFSRALALVPDTDLETQFELLLAREKAYDLQGARQAQMRDLAVLEELAERLQSEGVRARVALRRSQLALNLADYPASIHAASQAIAWSEAAGDTVSEATGYWLWGAALQEQGAYQAACAEYERACALAQTAGADQVLARSLLGLSALASYQGDYLDSRSYLEQAREIYHRMDDQRGEARCLRIMAIDANELGDHATALALAEEALRLYRKVGDRLAEGRCLNTLAIAARNEGDLSSAQSYCEQALSLHRELGNRASEGLVLKNLGYVIWEQGDPATARTHLEQALEIQRETGNRREESACLENLGMLACDLGEYDRARGYLQQGLDISREIGLRFLEGTLLNELGLVETAVGDFTEAKAVFAQSLAQLQELGHLQHRAEAKAGLAGAHLGLEDIASARTYVGELLDYLERDPELARAQRPFRVHLICYIVLRAAGDERADTVLRRAHRLLQLRAAKIPDRATRDSFLQNRLAHRELVQAYATAQSAG
jgi:predicted ATPase